MTTSKYEFVPECSCLCLTWQEHVEKFEDLAPRGDDLSDDAIFTHEMGGDAMTVTWSTEAVCPEVGCDWTMPADSEEEALVLQDVHLMLKRRVSDA